MTQDPTEDDVKRLVEQIYAKVDEFLNLPEAQEAFSAAGSDDDLWEVARRDPAGYLASRGVPILDGLSVTFVEVPGRQLTEDDETEVDLTLLARVTKVGSSPTLASGTVSLGIEISSGVRLLYTCRIVEVCREESDPAIWGGKILWGCRTVCVGTGWSKQG
jgi:hypothetical protein